MGDVETGHGDIHHFAVKPSEYMKGVIHAEDIHGKNTEKSKKASKPPRHPRGVSLDETDQRFIEELLLKRIKTERLKELKRHDNTYAAPSWLKRGLSYVLVIILIGFIVLIHMIMHLGVLKLYFH